MPKQRFGLGRGLDALIPGPSPVPADLPLDTGVAASAIFEVPVDAIDPNPYQPRAALEDDEAMLELAASLQQHGLLQPILVTQSAMGPDGPRYQVIAGERRWRAAQIAGLETLPAIIREATPRMMLELALVENLQRTDLNPLEAAHGYATLIEEYGLTQEEVAERVGRQRPTVANTIRLLQLPDEIREYLLKTPKVFTEGHARAVLGITTGDADRLQAARQIIAQQMSVRAAEELARRYNQANLLLAPDRRGGKTRPQNYETRVLEEEFTRAVQMKVRLQRSTKGKGSLTLYFTNQEQLESLYQRLVAAEMAAGGEDSGLFAVTGLGETVGLDSLSAMDTLGSGAGMNAAGMNAASGANGYAPAVSGNGSGNGTGHATNGANGTSGTDAFDSTFDD
ncbi:MAG TPA: ParB/RepB/Spo0J family partition protein [Ktedonobacterales bacterium]